MGFATSSNQGLARPHRRASLRSLLGAAAVAAAGMLFAMPSANAAPFTLVDGNSTVDFETQTQAGMFDWVVDGQDVLEKQWFWFRVGNVAEQSIDVIPQAVAGTSDTNFNGQPDTLFVRYTQPAQYTVETAYRLAGGVAGSGMSDVTEQIVIKNLTNAPLDFHFFQYVDLDLSPVDVVTFPNTNKVQQTGAFGTVTETVLIPDPMFREAHFFPITLVKLNDALPTVLDGTPIAGPGDVTWAFQWDFTIGALSSVTISKDKLVQIPEPGSLALLAAAAGAGLIRRRR